jgi:putative hydrolase of the HAD superfamily
MNRPDENPDRPSPSEIHTLFFDFGKVIRVTSWRRVAARLRPLLPELDKAALLKVVFPKFLEYEAGQVTTQAFWAHVARGLGLNPPERHVETLSSQYLHVLAGYEMKMLSLIRDLAEEKTWEMAILSNSAPELAHYIEEDSILRNYFPFFFFSCHIGVRKPDPGIYRTAMRTLGRKPGECLFIDDQLPNVEAALELGFKTIHYTGFEDFIQKFRRLTGSG